jgi:flagellar motility protein MotE (MotC chaperone)
MVFKKAVKEWMILNQFGRRNLSNYQRSVLALELEEVFTKKAKENQIRKPNSVMQNSAEQKIDTLKELSKVASVSHDTITRVKKIEEKADEETKAKLRTGEISINQVYTDIKKQEKKEEQRNKVLSEINKRYHLVGIVYLL